MPTQKSNFLQSILPEEAVAILSMRIFFLQFPFLIEETVLMSVQEKKMRKSSRFRNLFQLNRKNMPSSLGKLVRYHTQDTQDRNSQMLDSFSVNRNTIAQTTSTEHLLQSIIRKAVVQKKKVMKNLASDMNRSTENFSLNSCRKPKLEESQRESIRQRIRKNVNRHTMRPKRQDEWKKKQLQQTFTKILKQIKYKNYARRESENENNSIGIQSYAASLKGGTHHMNQDSMAFSEGVYIICDGHGTNGKQISEFVSQTAHKLLVESYKEKKIDTYHIRSILKKVQMELDISGIDISYSGCTFLGIIVYEKIIYSVSVGDSKTILCNRITVSQLGTLHKPDHPNEKARIEASGAIIHPLQVAKDKYSGPNRIWAPGKNSWGPGLALSRAFGDKAARKYGVISDPDIKNILLTFEADFIVMGSDGLYDFLKDSEISFFVKKKLREDNYAREQIALDLVEEAKRTGGPECDDISCIIILL